MAINEISDTYAFDDFLATDPYSLWFRLCGDKSDFPHSRNGDPRNNLLLGSAILPQEIFEAAAEQKEVGQRNELATHSGTANLLNYSLLLLVAGFC